MLRLTEPLLQTLSRGLAAGAIDAYCISTAIIMINWQPIGSQSTNRRSISSHQTVDRQCLLVAYYLLYIDCCLSTAAN